MVAHQQTRLVRQRMLPFKHLPDITLPVAYRDHAGLWQLVSINDQFAHYPVLQGLPGMPGDSLRMPAMHHGRPSPGIRLQDQLNRDRGQCGQNLAHLGQAWLSTLIEPVRAFVQLTSQSRSVYLPDPEASLNQSSVFSPKWRTPTFMPGTRHRIAQRVTNGLVIDFRSFMASTRSPLSTGQDSCQRALAGTKNVSP